MQTKLPRLLEPSITKTVLQDGEFQIESTVQLGALERCTGVWLERWGIETPDSVFLGERSGDGWRTLTYGETLARVYRVAQGLIELGVDASKPIAILSENSIDHAVLALAAMHIGVPVATVSVAYSQMSEDCERLLPIIKSLDPSILFVSSGEKYKNALTKTHFTGKILVSADPILEAELLSEIEAEPADQIRQKFEAITPDIHARYLLTSGSTGTPKTVINTQRMLCANQQQYAQVWPFVDDIKLKVLDWLPWSHTFAANHNFNLILRNGGSYYIDDGRPMPGMIERTIENIKMIKPNIVFNVPRGYDVLASLMEKDEALCSAFFDDLVVLFYAAAALPQSTWEKLQSIALKTRGDVPFFTSSWGATETAPALTNIHFEMTETGNLGTPLPGTIIKFVPSGDKLEMRVKGPSVFPGYRNEPVLTKDAFDKDGFYKIGDAGFLIDDRHPEKGIAFNGRVTEDFKLSSGTWVSVGTLRPSLVSDFSPLALDFVVCGHDRDYIGVLMFASPALKELAGDDGASVNPSSWIQIPSVKAALTKTLEGFRKNNPGSAQHPSALIILDTPPNMQVGEITDKGYLNQRACLASRATEIEKLFDKTCESVLRLS